VNSRTIVGDDEQYAAWMALLANQVGVPARVVMGAVVPSGGVVTGDDVHAWVEVRVGDGSWRTLLTSAFMDKDKPAAQPPQSQQQLTGDVVPPPQPIPPPSTVGDQSDSDLRTQKSHKTAPTPEATEPVGGAGAPRVAAYVGPPVLVVGGVAGSILGAKLLRRRRRRSAPTASARFVGGWRELGDHARDLGVRVPGGAATRREQALALAGSTPPDLARTADRHVFGPTPPEREAAAAYWREIDAESRTMSSGVSCRRRLAAALSLTTFRRG
jgi:hypothetical protein